MWVAIIFPWSRDRPLQSHALNNFLPLGIEAYTGLCWLIVLPHAFSIHNTGRLSATDVNTLSRSKKGRLAVTARHVLRTAIRSGVGYPLCAHSPVLPKHTTQQAASLRCARRVPVATFLPNIDGYAQTPRFRGQIRSKSVHPAAGPSAASFHLNGNAAKAYRAHQ